MSKRIRWPQWINKIKKPAWWDWLDKVKTLLEILAILVAGWWAYTLFIQGEAPSLKTRGDIQGNLTWYSHSKDTCQADFEIEFKNIGKIDIDVSKARLSAGAFDELSGTIADSVRLIDPLKIPTDLLFVRDVNDYLAYKYAPDERAKHGFGFVVKRIPNKRILFKVEVWGKDENGNETADPTWTHYSWDWICGENPNPSPTPTPTAQNPVD